MQTLTRRFILTILLPILLGVGVFLLFSPSLSYQFVNWDDDIYVLTNTMVHSVTLDTLTAMWTHPKGGLWIPLTWLSYALTYIKWGPTPLPYHLVNIFLHALNTVLLCWFGNRLLCFLLKRESSAMTMGTACTVALLWAIHPTKVESVAWIAERKDMLAFFFLLLSSWAYLAYTETRKWPHYGLALLLFIASLWSKPFGLTIPVVWMGLDLLAQRKWPQTLLDKLPFLAVGALSAWVTATHTTLLQLTDLTLSERILNACYRVWFYLGKWILPTHLVPLYPYDPPITLLNPRYGFSVLGIGLSLGLLSWGIHKKRWLALGLIVSVPLAFLPMIGFVSAGQQAAADRFWYMPSFLLMIGIGSLFLCQVKEFTSKKAMACLGIASCLLIVWGSQTLTQLPLWENQGTFWKWVIDSYPHRIGTAYSNYGLYVLDQGNIQEAEPLLVEAVRLDPNLPEALLNLGLCYQRQNKFNEALEMYKRADRVSKLTQIPKNIGLIYEKLGQFDQAILAYQEALRRNPESTPTYCNLGNLYYKKHQLDLAISAYNKGLQYNPYQAEIYHNIGLIYCEKGQLQNSIPYFERCILLNPNIPSAYTNLAKVYNLLHQPEKATAILSQLPK